jgi:hypothetical protein
LQQVAVRELGPGGLERTRPAQVWVTASWLVAQAQAHGVRRISVDGRTWLAEKGAWNADAEATALTWS